MFFMVGAAAASSVLDYVSSLQQMGQLSPTGSGNGQASSPFSLGNTQGAGGAPTSSGTMGMAPSTMNTLLSAQSQTTTPALTPDQSQVFSALDTNGDGQLNKSEFETLFGPGNTSVADAIFSKVDTNGDGEVSQNELAAALKAGEAKEQSLAGDTGSSTSQGEKTQTIVNANGSSTTTITYADGSQVSVTTPPASSGSNAVANNLLEQLIQRQALAVASVGQSVSMNV